ncbi:Thioredoxin domain-containing protein 3 [Saguinus oedipus]|uniref:Thioredoxin domain-containing protein 3 n=1 Tax=Saguinus oedipus TaxID=9490 RepID=A0ABQ9UFK6_SAGOE|nr:Thioredoxin domain-containing protein 3 [Saguinus oedipus]
MTSLCTEQGSPRVVLGWLSLQRQTLPAYEATRCGETFSMPPMTSLLQWLQTEGERVRETGQRYPYSKLSQENLDVSGCMWQNGSVIKKAVFGQLDFEVLILQEYLGRQHVSQFCDIEEDATNVAKFLDIFFPDFKKIKGMKLEKILALLRPNLFHERKDNSVFVVGGCGLFYLDTCKIFSLYVCLFFEIVQQEAEDDVLRIIKDEDFKILEERQLVLSEDEAQALCKEYENEDYFKKLIENMTSGPSLALVLLRDNGLEYWKQLLGPRTVEEAIEYFPESLCARFAMDSLPVNQLYGSDSLETAEREIKHFFPLQSTLGLIKPHATREHRVGVLTPSLLYVLLIWSKEEAIVPERSQFLKKILKIIKEAGFDLTQVKQMLLTPDQAEKIYSKITGKDFYKDLLEMLSEGPSMVMVLTKWNAVAKWRLLIGPTDPEEAKVLSPDSIRAQFGISKLRNIVHGASTVHEAKEVINRLFEDFSSDNPEEN